MSLTERTAVDDVLAARERYVARGVAAPRLVVVRAEGAQIEATVTDEELARGLALLEESLAAAA